MATNATIDQINHIRLLIGDVLTDNMAATDLIFTDALIGQFYDIEACNINRAAAYGLEVLANNIALLEGQRNDLRYSVDGPAVAESLNMRAVQLRSRRSSYALTPRDTDDV